MFELIASLILGALQGIAEFLPISSSAHFSWARQLLGVHFVPMSVFALLQLATTLGMARYLWVELGSIPTSLKNLFQEQKVSPELYSWIMACLAVVPVSLMGLLIKDDIEAMLHASWIAPLFLAFGSLALLFADRWALKKKDEVEVNSSEVFDGKAITWVSASMIGCVQVLALLPGISRFGSTSMMALVLGYSHRRALRFSFQVGLIVSVLVGIKGANDLAGVISVADFSNWIPSIALCCFCSFVIGPKLLLWIEKRGFGAIALYGVMAGLIGTFILYFE